MGLVMQSQELLHYSLLNKYFSTHCLPGTVLGSGHTVVKEKFYILYNKRQDILYTEDRLVLQLTEK